MGTTVGNANISYEGVQTDNTTLSGQEEELSTQITNVINELESYQASNAGASVNAVGNSLNGVIERLKKDLADLTTTREDSNVTVGEISNVESETAAAANQVYNG